MLRRMMGPVDRVGHRAVLKRRRRPHSGPPFCFGWYVIVSLVNVQCSLACDAGERNGSDGGGS